MSSFKITARRKASGDLHEVWVLDDYFGRRIYGYIPNTEDSPAFRESEFYEQYEPEGK